MTKQTPETVVTGRTNEQLADAIRGVLIADAIRGVLTGRLGTRESVITACDRLDALLARLQSAERERDATRTILDERIVNGRSFRVLIDEWLASNKKTPEQVLHGLFPLGMVGTWVERAEAAEAALKQTREALRLMLDMYERHSGWCGYNKNAPGDHIHNTATRAARAALAASGPEETP